MNVRHILGISGGKDSEAETETLFNRFEVYQGNNFKTAA